MLLKRLQSFCIDLFVHLFCEMNIVSHAGGHRALGVCAGELPWLRHLLLCPLFRFKARKTDQHLRHHRQDRPSGSRRVFHTSAQTPTTTAPAGWFLMLLTIVRYCIKKHPVPSLMHQFYRTACMSRGGSLHPPSSRLVTLRTQWWSVSSRPDG